MTVDHLPATGTQTGPYRFLTCPKWKRNMLRLVPGGASIICKSCDEPHFYTREEINAIWDQLEQEQAQSQRQTQKQHP